MNARPQYDLHTHSTVSDGTLTPSALIRRALDRGVDVLALTDHDEVSGLDEASAAANSLGMAFVCGTELSVSWRDLTLHVVGLNIDPRGCHYELEGDVSLDPYRAPSADKLVDAWVPLSVAVNEIQRSMGQPDSYPFVLSTPVVEKLEFIRGLVARARQH